MSNTLTDQLQGSLALAHERRLRNLCGNDSLSEDNLSAIRWALAELRRLRHEDEPAWERGLRALAAAQNAASECRENGLCHPETADAFHRQIDRAGQWFKDVERHANYTADDAAADRAGV